MAQELEIIGSFTDQKDAERFSVSAARLTDAYVWYSKQPDGSFEVRTNYGIRPTTPEKVATMRQFYAEWRAGKNEMVPMPADQLPDPKFGYGPGSEWYAKHHDAEGRFVG